MKGLLMQFLVIFIHIVFASTLSLGDQSQGRRIGVPSEPCKTPGQKISDSVDKTMYYICIPIDGGTWIPVQQMCPVGGVFIPDPTHPACTEIMVEGTSWPPEFSPIPEEEDNATSPKPFETIQAVFDLALKGIMKLDLFKNN